jgi:hypothetical protein
MKTLFTFSLVLLCVSLATPQAKKEVKKSTAEVASSPKSTTAKSWGSTFQIAENIRVVLRGDFFDSDFLVKDSGFREVFAVAGLDFAPAKDVHLIPNALYTHRLYKKKLTTDPALNDDITVRLTFAYSFSAHIQ